MAFRLLKHTGEFNGLCVGGLKAILQVTAIKLAAHRNVGAGFSLRPNTRRSLKAAPTGLNLMALTLQVGTA